MHLIDQIEDDRHGVVIHAHALQISDQLSARDVDFGKRVLAAVLRHEPAGFEPDIQSPRFVGY